MALALGFSPTLSAQQKEAQLHERLVKRPLYLRGFWMGRALEFDGAGKLLGDPQKDGTAPGPLTLSGVDATSISLKGDVLTIHGQKVALVADEEGQLQRLGLFSTTLLFGTLQKKYEGKEEIKITLHADAAGSFDAALKAVFADGLADLATSVPTYWHCYAEGHFVRQLPQDEAEEIVDDCVQHGTPDTAADTAAQVVQMGPLHWTRQSVELRVNGESRVHIVVGPHGVPVRFQILRAVGAGLDESTLQSVSESTFTPATKNGAPVAGGFEFRLYYSTKR